MWLKELNFILIYFLKKEYDSQNWIRVTELNFFIEDDFFSKLTLFFEYDSKNRTRVFEYDSKNWTIFFFEKNDAMNWTFF